MRRRCKPRVLRCLRCEYEWCSRVYPRPVACPRCRSYVWFKKAKRLPGGIAKKKHEARLARPRAGMWRELEDYGEWGDELRPEEGA